MAYNEGCPNENCENRRCKYNKVKKHKHSTDDKFAFFAYIIFIFYILSCIFFDDTTIFIQKAFSSIYISILVLLLLFVISLSFLIMFRKYKAELIILCMLFIGTIVLFFEKSYFYILSPEDLNLGHYFTYISLNIAEVTFTLYRLIKVKELLHFHTESAQYFKEHDERMNSNRGDDNAL